MIVLMRQDVLRDSEAYACTCGRGVRVEGLKHGTVNRFEFAKESKVKPKGQGGRNGPV